MLYALTMFRDRDINAIGMTNCHLWVSGKYYWSLISIDFLLHTAAPARPGALRPSSHTTARLPRRGPYIILYYITLYYIILYYIILYYSMLYYIILYHPILYYTTLYYIILYLYYIILQYNII